MSRAAFAPRCTVATRVPCGASRRRWTNTASAAWEFTLLLRSTISEKADAASEFLNFATWTAVSVAPQHQGGEHGSLDYEIWIADERSSGEERNAQDQCPKTPRQAHAHKVPEEVSRLPHERDHLVRLVVLVMTITSSNSTARKEGLHPLHSYVTSSP